MTSSVNGTRILREIQTAFSGDPKLLLPAVGTMFVLKYKAQELVKIPLPDHPGQNAGPTFEYLAE